MYTIILANKIFQGVKTLKFPPANTFLLQGNSFPYQTCKQSEMKAMALKTTSFVKKNFGPALYRDGQTNYVRKHRTIKSHAKDVRFSFLKFYAVFCKPARLLSQIKTFSRYQCHLWDHSLQLRLFIVIGLTCNRVTLCRSSNVEGAENLTSSSHFCLCVSIV